MTMFKTFIKDLFEPWFTLTKLGTKKTCGYINRNGDLDGIKKGDLICLDNDEFGFLRSISVKVIAITFHSCFHDYLRCYGLQNCLPGMTSINEGVSVYREFYSVETEQKQGVMAIQFELI